MKKILVFFLIAVSLLLVSCDASVSTPTSPVTEDGDADIYELIISTLNSPTGTVYLDVKTVTALGTLNSKYTYTLSSKNNTTVEFTEELFAEININGDIIEIPETTVITKKGKYTLNGGEITVTEGDTPSKQYNSSSSFTENFKKETLKDESDIDGIYKATVIDPDMFFGTRDSGITDMTLTFNYQKATKVLEISYKQDTTTTTLKYTYLK